MNELFYIYIYLIIKSRRMNLNLNKLKKTDSDNSDDDDGKLMSVRSHLHNGSMQFNEVTKDFDHVENTSGSKSARKHGLQRIDEE